MMEKKLFLVLSVHYCQADPILKVAPFQINRTRFSPPTITQKGDKELSTKKHITADQPYMIYFYACAYEMVIKGHLGKLSFTF